MRPGILTIRDVHDGALAPIVADDETTLTYGSTVDLPGMQLAALRLTIEDQELDAAEMVWDRWAKVAKARGQCRHAQISMDALELLLAAEAEHLGSSSDEQRYCHIGSADLTGFWRLTAQCLYQGGLYAGGAGDAHLIFHRCQISGLTVEWASEDYAVVDFDFVAYPAHNHGRVASLLDNETALDSAAAIDTYFVPHIQACFPQIATDWDAAWGLVSRLQYTRVGAEADGPIGAYREFNAQWVLTPGTYKLRATVTKHSDRGIFACYLRPRGSLEWTEIGQIDCYATGSSIDDTEEISGIEIDEGGPYDFRLELTAAGAEDGLLVVVTMIEMIRTSGAAEGNSVDYLPWTIDVPIIAADRNSGYNNLDTNNSSVFQLRLRGGAQGDYLEYVVELAAGVWDLRLLHARSADRPIYHLSVDGVEVGQIDGYNSSLLLNQIGLIEGIEVATPGLHVIRIASATKNALSSGYRGELQWLQLRRVA